MSKPHLHDLHRHDDDGFTGHPELHKRAKKRFLKAAKRYCAALRAEETFSVEQLLSLEGLMLDAFDHLLACE